MPLLGSKTTGSPNFVCHYLQGAGFQERTQKVGRAIMLYNTPADDPIDSRTAFRPIGRRIPGQLLPNSVENRP